MSIHVFSNFYKGMNKEINLAYKSLKHKPECLLTT